ncbi:MAG: hypothetical protein HY858_15390 [Candidatus Solibacter usitatus]|nr:hypothetical protein [Candidatus Solibacter usitatus]
MNALAAAVAAGALGWLVLGVLRVRLRGGERWPAAMACGSPLMAALARVHWGVMAAAAVVLLALAVWRRKDIRVEESEPLPRWAVAACAAVGVAYGWMALSDAAAEAAAIPHFLFLPWLALAVLAAARRVARPAGAVCAGLLTFTSQALMTYAGQEGPQVLVAFCLFSSCWLAALAWQSRQFRLLLPAVLLAVFTSRIWTTTGTAFGGFLFDRLPWAAVPFAALLAGWAVQRLALWAAVLAAFQLVTAWPPVTELLAPAWTRRLAEERKLAAQLGAYLDESVPAAAFVLTDMPLLRSRTTRNFTDSKELLRMARVAIEPVLQPSRERRIPLMDTPRRRFAIERGGWVSEVRFFHNGVELSRSPGWRVRTLEGEMRASLALDNSMVTGCDCALEVDFGAPVQFDEVWIGGTGGEFIGVPRGLRRAAIAALKQRGVTHILAGESGALADELNRNARYWGVTEVGARHGAHLFQLD